GRRWARHNGISCARSSASAQPPARETTGGHLVNTFRSADPVAHHAIRQPHSPAIAAGMREISYASLDGIVDAAAHALHVSARRGARVAIFVSDPLKHWVTILALQRLGAVS